MTKLSKYIDTLTDEQGAKALKLIETNAYADWLDLCSEKSEIHATALINFLKRKLTKQICQN